MSKNLKRRKILNFALLILMVLIAISSVIKLIQLVMKLIQHFQEGVHTVTEKKTSDAQLKASRKWQEKNKEQMKHVRNRSGAKGYIKNASLEELEELEQLIEERKKSLSN